jgi:hypothetical protein
MKWERLPRYINSAKGVKNPERVVEFLTNYQDAYDAKMDELKHPNIDLKMKKDLSGYHNKVE